MVSETAMIDKTFHHSTEDVCNSCKYRHYEQISTHRFVDICALHGEETNPTGHANNGETIVIPAKLSTMVILRIDRERSLS